MKESNKYIWGGTRWVCNNCGMGLRIRSNIQYHVSKCYEPIEIILEFISFIFGKKSMRYVNYLDIVNEI